jgi:hypothetical protein
VSTRTTGRISAETQDSSPTELNSALTGATQPGSQSTTTASVLTRPSVTVVMAGKSSNSTPTSSRQNNVRIKNHTTLKCALICTLGRGPSSTPCSKDPASKVSTITRSLMTALICMITVSPILVLNPIITIYLPIKIIPTYKHKSQMISQVICPFSYNSSNCNKNFSGTKVNKKKPKNLSNYRKNFKLLIRLYRKRL